VLDRVVCVIDRESGGADQLRAADLELHALFTMTQLRP
jgi:orotate phosphoribosyltransferase